ncbi:hypothetical protein BU16DRAFT_523461 [Lophium mytilinum]|uniref:RING-type domain-containing protein n=1 Tax=Lophium mytilinum TaxID=390894 RepID=A0A6A6RAB4_9PEZI|nr:hypothetical protein BU16DRAFT_523461 [Lophium mytilinum]
MSFTAPSRASTNPHIQPIVLWDPYTTLGIERDQRCVGEATSQNRKCRTALAYANANDMQKLLRKLSTRQPDADALDQILSRIAGYGLCRNKRNKHQEQSATVVQMWKNKIIEAYPGGVVEIANTTVPDAATPGLPTTRNTPSSRPSPELDGIDLARLRLVRQVLEGLDELSTRTNSRETSNTPVPTIEIPHQAIHSAPNSRTASPAPLLRRSVSSHTLSPHHHPISCPLGLIHEPRRAPDDECPICREPASDLSELTWCKSGCGRSMHTECVELWRESRMQSWFEEDDMHLDMVFSCALCRTEWVDCDCEE